MRKLTRAQLRPFAIGQLNKQGGLCPVCGLPISLQVMGAKSDYVVDHSHETGEVRGILHRSCNSGLGKMDNGIGRWIAKSMKYENILPTLRRVLAYYEQPGLNVMYPGHKTDEERAVVAKQKRNVAAARRKAALKVRNAQ